VISTGAGASQLIRGVRRSFRRANLNLEEYATRLGRLAGNLQSLEFVLRAYLYAQQSPPHIPFPAGRSLESFAVGDMVEENALTDYSTLGSLIERYNSLVRATHAHLCVDSSIVDIRDALAHGRISAADPSPQPLLLKFDRPANGFARVSFVQTLTAAWFQEQTVRIMGEVKKVAQAPNSPVVS
jgi:hypothetical protein